MKKLMFLTMGLISALSIFSCRENTDISDLTSDHETKATYQKGQDSANQKVLPEVDPDPPIKDTQDWKMASNKL